MTMMVQEFILILLGFFCFVSVILQIFILIGIVKLLKVMQKTEDKIDEKIKDLKEWIKEPFEIGNERD